MHATKNAILDDLFAIEPTRRRDPSLDSSPFSIRAAAIINRRTRLYSRRHALDPRGEEKRISTRGNELAQIPSTATRRFN